MANWTPNIPFDIRHLSLVILSSLGFECCPFSSKIVLRGFHQADEHVLQARFDFLPAIRAGHPRADAGAQFFRVAPAHVQRRAERDDLLDARQLADFFRQRGQIFAGLPAVLPSAGWSLQTSSARRPSRLRAPCRWRADFRRRCKPAGDSVPPRPCNAS